MKKRIKKILSICGLCSVITFTALTCIDKSKGNINVVNADTEVSSLVGYTLTFNESIDLQYLHDADNEKKGVYELDFTSPITNNENVYNFFNVVYNTSLDIHRLRYEDPRTTVYENNSWINENARIINVTDDRLTNTQREALITQCSLSLQTDNLYFLLNETLQQLSQLQTNFTNLQTEYNNLVNSNVVLQHEYDTLESTYNALLISNYELQLEYENLLSSYNTLESSYFSLQSDYDSLSTQYESLQNQYESLQNQYENLQNNYDSDLEQIRQEIKQEYEDTLNFLSSEITNLEDTITELYQTTNQQDLTILALQNALDHADSSNFDIVGTMFTVLTMPFTFISQAFNLTLFPNTPYQINFANLFKGLIAIATLLFIVRLLTNGLNTIGNVENKKSQTELNKSQTNLNNAKANKIRTENADKSIK